MSFSLNQSYHAFFVSRLRCMARRLKIRSASLVALPRVVEKAAYPVPTTGVVRSRGNSARYASESSRCREEIPRIKTQRPYTSRLRSPTYHRDKADGHTTMDGSGRAARLSRVGERTGATPYKVCKRFGVGTTCAASVTLRASRGVLGGWGWSQLVTQLRIRERSGKLTAVLEPAARRVVWRRPSRREKTGAQITVENFESMRTRG